MQLETFEGYSGDVYSVQASIYSKADLAYEEGVFEEWAFDNEAEAQAKFNDEAERNDYYQDILDQESDPYFNRLGLFLTWRAFVNGQDVDYDRDFYDCVIMQTGWQRWN